jgi:hypothetical protein
MPEVKTESEVLSKVMDSVRALSMSYYNKLRETDLFQVFESKNGVRLNCAFWIMAHLAVTENFLLLYCTGGEHVKITWSRQFGMGSVMPRQADCPSIETVIDTLSEVHQYSLKHVAQLDETSLALPTRSGFKLGGEDTIRATIMHAIRHEGSHAGHLGWLCKLNGIKTI